MKIKQSAHLFIGQHLHPKLRHAKIFIELSVRLIPDPFGFHFGSILGCFSIHFVSILKADWSLIPFWLAFGSVLGPVWRLAGWLDSFERERGFQDRCLKYIGFFRVRRKRASKCAVLYAFFFATLHFLEGNACSKSACEGCMGRAHVYACV